MQVKQKAYSHNKLILKEEIILLHASALTAMTCFIPFHYVFELLNLPPDRLDFRIIATIPLIIFSYLVYFVPKTRVLAPYFSIVGSTFVLGTLHLLVIRSGNNPMYLASTFMLVFGMQYAVIKLKHIILLYALNFLVCLALYIPYFTNEKASYFPILLFVCQYFISLVVGITKSFYQKRMYTMRKVIKEQSEELALEKEIGFQREKMAALGEMASGIAHEVNNPLSIILMNSSSIEKELDRKSEINKDSILKKVKKTQDTVYRINNIIKGLRDFARNTTSDPYINVSTKKIIDLTIGMCESRIIDENIKLTLKYDENDTEIQCRSTEVSQVILNLIGNSIDVVKGCENKWIEVSTKKLESDVEIRVTDSGSGVSTEHQDKIFKPFFSTKAAGEGSGLGLSISRQLVESHNGSLNLDLSQANTAFVIKFPAHSKVESHIST